MFTCREFLDGLCDYLDGLQDRRARAEAERHLRKCGRCRILCDTTRETVRLYRNRAEVRPVPAEVEARVLGSIRRVTDVRAQT